MVRVLIYGMNYAPELSGVGRYTSEIGDFLAASGHSVSVVTGIPHYPGWRATPPYRNGRFYREKLDGVQVVRCPLFLREPMQGVSRLLAPLTFALTSAPVVVWKMLRERPQVVICVEPTLLGAPSALFGAWLARAKTVLHVQDLEVDASFAVGHLTKFKWLMKACFAFERAVLSRFGRIVTISGKMAARLCDKGVPPERIVVVRNWIDLEQIKPLERPSLYRGELGLRETEFVVLYSGSIGAKQGLSSVLDAAAHLATSDSSIRFVIAGEGPARSELLARYGKLRNVMFLPFQPYDRLGEFLGLADIHILPQLADAADLVLPSKVGGMLASGKRILVQTNDGTELATFLQGLAVFVAPGDDESLRKAILRCVSEPRENASDAKRRYRRAQALSKIDGLSAFEAVTTNWVKLNSDGSWTQAAAPVAET
jgi:colanic acid biosynthesis glycosyl transferase WcaI